MKRITKKRFKAYLIDAAISATVTYAVECFVRKKVKNEAVHALVTPTAVMWTLEWAQLRRSGQTLGFKQQRLVLEDETGQEPSSEQIFKRMAYRDTIGGFSYLKDPKGFSEDEGAIMAQDRYAGTKVRED
ncbi:RDD family protein [Lentibacillus amyloliquefaciens]|uniref:RDD family protein n=1 Tax=Lentibacillus amyloliquefaciens TaxID=1472767 RepID=A0A0U4FSQ6_9BACI|nr:RDD family protein [Lentibacillus amyloliquefaciens]ALX48917.1 RDD family protein [Lentibacillus amyloliquefaciens]